MSPWLLEVQKLVHAGVDERVVLLYITNTAGVFNLTPEQIIHLKKQGVSPRIMNAMIHHDATRIAGSTTATADLAHPPFAQPAPANASVPSILTAPDPEPGPQIIANDERWMDESLFPEDDYYAPDQPESAGPVRAPYAVKLNDPIVILKLPTFAVPYW